MTITPTCERESQYKVSWEEEGTNDGAQEDRVGREVGCEAVRVREQLPWAHDEAHKGCDVSTTSDVDESRKEGRQVASCADGVGSDVGSQLSDDETDRDECNSGAGAAGGVAVEESAQEVEGRPHVLAEDDGRGRGDDDCGPCVSAVSTCGGGVHILPKKETIPKVKGRAMSWGRMTLAGCLEREAKSTAFVMRVATVARDGSVRVHSSSGIAVLTVTDGTHHRTDEDPPDCARAGESGLRENRSSSTGLLQGPDE